jgi:hypothetical protein
MAKFPFRVRRAGGAAGELGTADSERQPGYPPYVPDMSTSLPLGRMTFRV